MLSCIAFAYGLSHYFPSPVFSFPFRTYISVFLLLVGIVFMLHAVLRFWQNKTTISPLSPQDTKALVTDGFNRISRNPMYLGMSLVLAAAIIHFAAWSAMAAFPLFIVILNILQIIPEERMLEAKFGEEYLRYKARVRRWL